MKAQLFIGGEVYESSATLGGRLGVHGDTIRAWRQGKKIDGVKIGSQWYYCRRSVDKALARGLPEPSSNSISE